MQSEYWTWICQVAKARLQMDDDVSLCLLDVQITFASTFVLPAERL